MLYAAAVVERAMKMQEVILRVLSGALTWLQAATFSTSIPHPPAVAGPV